jgi:hypothetical protein
MARNPRRRQHIVGMTFDTALDASAILREQRRRSDNPPAPTGER